MHILVDQKEKISGYLYHNVILLPGYKVAGVLLAHCVFTNRGEVKGKYFEGYIYNESGEIIAKEATGDQGGISEDEAARIMKEAWTILSFTTTHNCPWVLPASNWSKMTLEEFLTQ